MTNQSDMTNYLQTFVEGMISSGVEQAVISPGSRSTPLALLLHRQGQIETFTEVDERSAAFFALGLSKASSKPVVLLCTSGTAAANYYPAICEAYASHIPLIVLTTDRPHELRQVGAPQAMDQFHLFQGHVKEFIEMAIPEGTKIMLDYAYWQGMRATDTACQIPKGPIHLNFPLREPLLPNLDRSLIAEKTTTILAGKKQLSKEQIINCVDAWQGKQGILVVGGNHTSEEAEVFIQLAETLNWPIISDPLANITACGKNSPLIMRCADLFIQEVEMIQYPEVVVRFGMLPISKNTMFWLQSLEDKTTMYFVDETGEWQDQLKQTQVAIQAEEQTFIQAIINKVETKTVDSWSNQWMTWQEITEQQLNELSEMKTLNETSASLLVHKKMADNGQLFVSNSNAIRFLDRFSTAESNHYQLFGNRGINGIDGIVSTALGMCAINPERQNVLLIGDLAMYHDMNGLLLAKRYNLPLTIILLNNNGGGIFSFLSQRQLAVEDFEPIFGTPIDLDFSLVAQLYDANYVKAESLEQLAVLLEKTQKQPAFQIIEVVGERQENVQLYEKVMMRLKEKLREKE
ncbi:2-succinyl-5-enolpyruvyl-6-hydroxy-3-cyclohexene-1-carboxylic-acid synthase [Candidatus Enterococcus lemimoniae]|uniref:2-succinyl-5-enolpyruvyl-6-hydroxy-3-cyclohexene-1-carboxylate synthase n=1 Tax=Candidatus Enterococcus lemimoniae TaxID=1834167 RepID=A0ABZ2TBD1_9ENTE|nr:2-succinyl-5-enolpyruvyl-6-hydroxy-3-cyclohexene-1-carboxylic-acid synthase [Enterococcus sp. 12C11_DIV0727]OTO70969.1 2-succinyl-5-enolpyruvyl-6-hydroxy-3-cyclohexene-1-carboxylic-acid synthase [Enterococcus sp. 12C11_DIV0727]